MSKTSVEGRKSIGLGNGAMWFAERRHVFIPGWGFHEAEGVIGRGIPRCPVHTVLTPVDNFGKGGSPFNGRSYSR